MTNRKTIILIILSTIVAYGATLGIGHATTNAIVGIISGVAFGLAVAVGVTAVVAWLAVGRLR